MANSENERSLHSINRKRIVYIELMALDLIPEYTFIRGISGFFYL